MRLKTWRSRQHWVAAGLLVASGVIVGVLAGWFAGRSDPSAPETVAGRLADVVVGSFRVQQADATGERTLSDEEAQRLLVAAARERFTAARSADNSWIQGRRLVVEDLVLAEMSYVPGAVDISSSSGTFGYRSSTPRDVWVAVFRATNVDIRDVGIPNGVIEVHVAIDDKEAGEVRAATFFAYNPTAP